jgi:hypothetical protein
MCEVRPADVQLVVFHRHRRRATALHIDPTDLLDVRHPV